LKRKHPLGSQVILDLEYATKEELLNRTPRQWLHLLKKAAVAAGAHVIKSTYHVFREKDDCNEPGGITAVVILEESHITIHTWTKEREAHIDIFTCGDKCKPWVGAKYIIEQTKPIKVNGKKRFKRGGKYDF